MLSIEFDTNQEAEDFKEELTKMLDFEKPVVDYDCVEKVIRQIEEKLEWED